MISTRDAILLAIAMVGCQEPQFDDNDGDATSGDVETGDGDGESTTTGDGDDGPVFNCDPSDDMPCASGEKCTVLGPPSNPTYDCVPDDGFRLPFEPCTPAPADGQDGCLAGFTCLPISADAPDQGLCLELCSVDSNCELAFCSASPGTAVNVCAAICDPLASACPETQDCQRIRQSVFVCQYPLPNDTGAQADPCDGGLDVGCTEGFVCQAGDIVPECIETSCCTALCDLSEPDVCAAGSLCGELDLDPVPGLEDVGACYIPQ